MFNASFSEVLFILILAFVILGPEKLATTAQTVGLGLKKIKLWYAELQNDLNNHDS